MTNVLTAVGAAFGLGLFLIMAVVPLILDLPEQGERPPEREREPITVPVVPLRVPAQREPSAPGRRADAELRPVGLRA